MAFYLPLMIVFSICMLGATSVTFAFSIENPNKSLSYTEKNCDNDSCKVTTCFENKPCIITDSNELSTKTTSSNDETPQLFDNLDSESDSKTLEFMDIFDNFFDFN